MLHKLRQLRRERTKSRAEFAFESKDYKNAKRLFQRIISWHDNDETWALVNQSICEHELGDHHESKRLLLRAVSLSNDDLEANYNLANEEIYLNNYSDALTYYDRVLSQNPRHVPSLVGRGLALGNLNRDEEALDCFREALEIEPLDTKAKVCLAETYEELGELQRAEKLYRELAGQVTNETYPLVRLGNNLFFQRRFEAAVTQYQKAIRLGKVDDIILYNLGLAYVGLGQLVEANEQLIELQNLQSPLANELAAEISEANNA